MTRRTLLFSGLSPALRRRNLDEAVRLIESKVASGDVSAAALEVRSGREVFQRAFGAARGRDAVFLLASISKPMTASGVMILADRGELALDDAVSKFIPEFRGGERDRVTIRHLLTHTSGLPDMLPENTDLRKRHAPLKDFVARTCRTPLLFSPGTQVRYQSMGILLAAEIAERITRRPFRDFLRQEVFLPLGMNRTSLGLGGRKISETMLCQVEDDTDWNWNSLYWRDLGSPWGGVHSTAGEVGRFLHYFVEADSRVLRPATAAAMITNQNQSLDRAWGLGWMLGPAEFWKRCSPRTFGHSGSTGTLAWLDPVSRLSLVLLTTKPAVVSGKTLLRPVADLVSGAG